MPAVTRKPLQNKFGLRLQNVQKCPRTYQLSTGQLPDQETIQKREDEELKIVYPIQEENSEVISLKQKWETTNHQFQKMKRELETRQKDVIDTYTILKNMHKLMTAYGEPVTLPYADELKIINIAKVTPDQLLQFCSYTALSQDSVCATAPDMNKLYELPTKLVSTCEQTLAMRQNIIDWFEHIKTEEKGISMSKLTKKIKEFTAENEMLHTALETSKANFLQELNEIVDYMRKNVKEMIALQVRIEDQTYEVSELHAKNTDLRKQLQNTEYMKSSCTKQKIEALEKELKEEKCKKLVIKDRLTRMDGQVKIFKEKGVQLEAALQQTQQHSWQLDKMVGQLKDQNQQQRINFERELNELTNLIKANSQNLEYVTRDKEQLQAQKLELEQRIVDLLNSNKDTEERMRLQKETHDTLVQDLEKKLENVKDEKKLLESKLESLQNQYVNLAKQHKDSLMIIQKQEEELRQAAVDKDELVAMKKIVDTTNVELVDYKDRIVKQTATIEEIEGHCKELYEIQRSLKAELRVKEKCIAELEKNQSVLEQEIHEGEHKMETYEAQLHALKTQIEQVHKDFGEFGTFNELQEMINQQRSDLLESTHKNEELDKALKEKEQEVKNQLEHLTEHKKLLLQKDGIIDMLTRKEEEQENSIKTLRYKLENKMQGDFELNQQLLVKDTEVNELYSNLETRKQQVSQLEKIILSLEGQLRKVNAQRKKDREIIEMLEKAMNDPEDGPLDPKKSVKFSAFNLDKLLRILEDELEAPSPKPSKHVKQSNREFRNIKKIEELGDGLEISKNYQVSEIVKKPVWVSHKKSEDDNLNRKSTITSIETLKRQSENPNNFTSVNLNNNDIKHLKTLRGMIPVAPAADYKNNKKGKMLRLAGHKL